MAFTYRRRKTLVGTMDLPAKDCPHISIPESWVSMDSVIRGLLKGLPLWLLPPKAGAKDVQSIIVHRLCALKLSLAIILQ